MGNRYYRPNIDEFHLNFKYEFRGGNGYRKEILNCESYSNPLQAIKDLIDINQISVKYLDIDDINALGWTAFGSDAWKTTFENLQLGCSFKLVTDENVYELHYNSKDLIIIYNVIEAEQLFSGTIKNINELEVIMKQIHIL